MANLDDYPEALSTTQVGELLGISRLHAWRLVERGELPSFRLGRLVKVPKWAVRQLLEHGTVTTPKKTTAPRKGSTKKKDT